MKKILIITNILLLSFIKITAQNWPANSNAPISTQCEEGKGISTNPANPSNSECSNILNNFDWRVKHTPGGTVPDERFWVYYQDDNSPEWIRNPFNGPIDATYTPFLTANHGSNYQPEDGWELLKVDFGSNGNIGLGVNVPPGASSNNTSRPKLPYMILYNKYTGTLRFFGSLLEPDNTYETVRIELRIPKQTDNSITENYQNDLKATNLLSIQGTSVQPLDQETDETALVVFVKYTNNPQIFFWFDIPVAYDPCLCNNRAQLDISFAFVQTANIDITGSISGSIKTEKKGTTDYAKMVFSRVLAAGVSGASAIATKGAVINVKAFIDLVDIVKDHPFRNINDKNNLTTLKNYLTCTEKLYSVISSNYKDVIGLDEKKQMAAGQKLLDANTTFLSSLVSGCSNSDNGATTITGVLKASGTFTLIDEIQGTKIAMVLPGSKWNDKSLQGNSFFENSGKFIPSYPTYNERLGTLALLETPKFKINNTYSYQAFEDVKNYNSLIFQQNSDFKITFNPLLSLNMNKTKILARIVIDTNYVSWPSNFTKYWDVNNPNETYISPFNLVKNDGSQYNYTSSFVDYEYLKNMIFRIDIGSGQNIISKFEKRVFVQFKIIGESNNIGFDGKNISFYQIMNFPIIFDEIQNISNVLLKDGNINQLIKEYDSDVQFSKTENIIFEGPVYISAKMSTTNGAKVKIYSMIGFELESGAEISPDIELIVGYPWEKIPQPLQTYAQVSEFCGNNNKYKAQTFSQSAIKREKEEYEARQIREEEAIKQKSMIAFKLSPNPTTANFTVSIFNNNEQDYSIALMDVTGKVLFNNSYNGKQTSQFIETNGLAAGIYFVKIRCGNTQKTEKLIIGSGY